MKHRFLRGLAIFLIAIGLFSLTTFFSKPQSVSAATISSSTWYTVVNQGNGKCVDNANGGTANGNVIQQWACSANNVNQQWQFVPTSGGNYEVITHNAAGMVWDIAGPSTANGALLHLWTYGGGANQQWMPVALDATHYKFVNLYSGTCLDIPAASTTDGVQLEQYICNGTGAQSWSLNAVGGSPTATATFVPATATPIPTTASGNGSPFSGTPYSIPGKVEAENYNTGGEGVAYHDSDATNSGGQYRTDGVDIEATTDTGGGFNVGWTATGEWENYTVNVTSAGTYTVDVRVAANAAGSALHLEVDGANVTGSLAVPSTGGWQTWSDVTKTGVSLSAGQHVVRLFIDAGGMNINWFSFSGGAVATNTPSGADGTPFSGTAYSIPGKVEAENYNNGGQNVAYSKPVAGTSTTNYRSDSAAQIEATTDTGGGFDVGWTATGDWYKYTVNVPSSGTYSIDVRVASANTGSALHLEVDGANVTGSLTVPNTGGWQTWSDVTKSGVSLSAGQHVLRLFIDAGGMNINWINIISGTFTATPTPNNSGWPNRVFAPYMESTVESDMVNVANQTGDKFFTLAFIIDSGGCTASWEGAYNMSSGFMVSELQNLRNMGGDAKPSFGGAAGNELATVCGDVPSLQAQYQSVISTYNFTHLDFDIEGGPIGDTASIDRRNKALHNLQAANPNLNISYTLAVDTSGLPGQQIALLQNAVSNGVRVDIVNLMTMDYANDSRDMGQAAIQAAQSTVNQLASVYPGKTNAQLWHMIGETPMIGLNDTTPENFSISNAQAVLSFSQQQNIAIIAFWSVSRDHQCSGSISQPSGNCSGTPESNWGFINTFKAFTQ